MEFVDFENIQKGVGETIINKGRIASTNYVLATIDEKTDKSYFI